ncbi:MAG: RNA polymerase sigma factor [Nitrospirae bacterium]|nr:RNA polymerase sigma factor [Nitrospirota bacterium]
MDDDIRLVERYMAGDDMAMEEIVLKYQRVIYAFVYRMTRDMEEAKDLTQKTFMNVIGGIRNFRRQSSFKTWLYQIAAHATLNQIRQCRKNEVEIGETIVCNQKGALSLLMEKQRIQDVRSALSLLPERQRLTVVLRVYEGLNCEETAGVMGCSEGAVKAQYHNGVRKLREAMKEKGHDTVS